MDAASGQDKPGIRPCPWDFAMEQKRFCPQLQSHHQMRLDREQRSAETITPLSVPFVPSRGTYLFLRCYLSSSGEAAELMLIHDKRDEDFETLSIFELTLLQRDTTGLEISPPMLRRSRIALLPPSVVGHHGVAGPISSPFHQSKSIPPPVPPVPVFQGPRKLARPTRSSD